MSDPKILVVDDNASFCSGLQKALNAKGYVHVRTAHDGWQALESVQQELPDLVILDLYLPGMDGLHLMSAIHKIDKKIVVLMLTCESDGECMNAAVSLGAQDYLVKPLELSTLFASVENRLKEKAQAA